jgi:translation initiation factor IF-3
MLRRALQRPFLAANSFISSGKHIKVVSSMRYMSAHNTSAGGGKKITTKTLCDITGTKYYEHNDGIEFTADKVVRVYDENEQIIGDMKFGEAFSQAMALKKDIVLRNAKTDPPICKIMNYKLELLKKLFKKLGKDLSQKDEKSKSIRLTTTISVHDLENKKRKSAEFLKQFSTLKFFMKVNIYDPENVQKGRLMLLNIAEDLKEYARVKVSPGGEKKAEPKKGEKKPKDLDSIKEKAESQAFVKLTDEVDEEHYDEDLENRPSYIFMELESTASFKDIDIDKMLEHTTMDDFMRGLYVSNDKEIS